ncbi:hypothetical protein N665_0640s0007 [Sinapis alba]|nr:hypothetical protein N665_0640s0007 [Sinapis alba]
MIDVNPSESRLQLIKGIALRLSNDGCLWGESDCFETILRPFLVPQGSQTMQLPKRRETVCVVDPWQLCDRWVCLQSTVEQRNSFRSDAFDIFKEMILMRTQMDEVVVYSMLKICTTMAAISIGRQIHCLALKSSQIRFDVALCNSLIDMYAKSGEIEDAVLAFKEMEEKDVRSWTSLISGHVNIEKAIDLYNRMEHEGTQPNDVTFLALLSACSHTGKTELGWNIFNTMINKYGYQSSRRALILHRKYACTRRHGNMQLSEVAAVQLLSMEPKKPVNYINLASVYGTEDTGDWDNALKTRKLMKEWFLQ